MIELALSWIALTSALVGSIAWLIRATYKASIYLAQIRDSLNDLNGSVRQLRAQDAHIEQRLSDVERYLGKTTDFTPRNY